MIGVKRKKKHSAISTFWWIILPQSVLLLALVIYLICGALTFRWLDESLAEQSIWDVILFEYGTLATIGWGNVYPTTEHARVFACLYALIGIPLFLLYIASVYKYVTKLYWYVLYGLGFPVRCKISSDARLPIKTILFLFLFTFAGGSFFIKHTGDPFTIDDIYFSFISFTTVGFGDTSPVVHSLPELILTMMYLTWGIVLTTALFRSLNDFLRKVHYLGRRFRGARDVPVYIGGQTITVSQLMATVAQEFDASPKEIRTMLHDLDDLISASTKSNVPLIRVNDIEDFDCYE
ncbi:unnamed protein product, partial [Mesorhabditis belari]|uniref:Potassium channel domain-containing protein n=1 Tax=Mesorhabditis belari TaxID=2138241 RepID=A0AAF3F509_9BILA